MSECLEGKKGRGERECSQTLILGNHRLKQLHPELFLSLGEDLAASGSLGCLDLLLLPRLPRAFKASDASRNLAGMLQESCCAALCCVCGMKGVQRSPKSLQSQGNILELP